MQFDKIVKSVLEGFGAIYTTNNHFKCLKIYFKDAALAARQAQNTYIMSVWHSTPPTPVAVKTRRLQLIESLGAVYGAETLDVKFFDEDEEQAIRAYLTEQLYGYIKQRTMLIHSMRKELLDAV